MTKIDILYNKNVVNKLWSEYYNALATNIQFLGGDIKKIVISSVRENEGKSTISINLSKSLADMGFKVLMIDGDTRNSVLLSRFKVRGKVEGLTSYLSGVVGIENVLYETDVNNLTILPAGQIPPNPTSLLQSRNFEVMLSAFEQYYDYIIIDAPPIGLVIDAAIIAKKCDGSILVVQSNLTKRKFVKKAKEQLEQSGSRFLGVVLNNVDIKSNSEEYGLYGNYGNYGEKNKEF